MPWILLTRTLVPAADGFQAHHPGHSPGSLSKKTGSPLRRGSAMNTIHYASAFIKSMRGSDPDSRALLRWQPCWRVVKIRCSYSAECSFLPSEDVGYGRFFCADPSPSAPRTAFERPGMPAGLYYLAHTCIYLSLAPKSTQLPGAVFQVMAEYPQRRGTGKGTSTPARQNSQRQTVAIHGTGKHPSVSYQYPHIYPFPLGRDNNTCRMRKKTPSGSRPAIRDGKKPCGSAC